MVAEEMYKNCVEEVYKRQNLVNIQLKTESVKVTDPFNKSFAEYDHILKQFSKSPIFANPALIVNKPAKNESKSKDRHSIMVGPETSLIDNSINSSVLQSYRI